MLDNSDQETERFCTYCEQFFDPSVSSAAYVHACQNCMDGHRESLPALIDLPVIRNIYCSQEMTDSVLQHLWEKRPDLIAAIVVEERGEMPDRHDGVYGKRCAAITEYLRVEAMREVGIPPTRLAMIDFLYELSRRLRRALGMIEVPVFGRPIASGPDGPFPQLAQRPIRVYSNGEPPEGMSQELSDRICESLYTQRPDLAYELSEATQRLVVSFEIVREIEVIIMDMLLPHEKKVRGHLFQQFQGRILLMSSIPRYEVMKEVFKK